MRRCLGMLAGLIVACSTPANAANIFELNFWLSGPRYDAVVFDLLTALIDSWTLWNAAAGSADAGLRWRRKYLELTYGQGTYSPYEEIVRAAAEQSGVGLSCADELVRRWDELPPWPETIAVLSELAKRAPLAVATNCSIALGRRAAARCGVEFAVVVTAEEAGRYGNTHRSVAPYQPLRAKSGSVAVAAANDGLFEKLCGALGRNDLLDDPRFTTNPERVEHRAELAEQLEGTLASAPPDEWIERLNAAGVPAGKIRGVLEALGRARFSLDR